MSKSRRSLQEQGFTLVELLVVMMIIGVLIALAIGGLNVARRNARDATRKTDARNIRVLLEDYYSKNKRYPKGPIGSGEFKTSGPKVTLYDGASVEGTLELEFGGDVSVKACSALRSADYDKSTEDLMEMCYETAGATSRPQTYDLVVGLENGDYFEAAVE